MAASAKCTLLSSCCATDAVCLPKKVGDDVCEVLRGAQPTVWSSGRTHVPEEAMMFPMQPLMFPPPHRRAKAPTPEATTLDTGATPASSSHIKSSGSVCSGSPTESTRFDDWDDEAVDGPTASEISARISLWSSRSLRSWSHDCEKQRARLSAEKELIQRVVGLGPQLGHMVDIHTGKHRALTYWLRDDVRALCIFSQDETTVKTYPCSQMERCERLDGASEVAARKFFLGLGTDDLRRGLLVTMERVTHSVQVMQQGHVGLLRAQFILLCADREQQKALLGAVTALMAELLVHERRVGSVQSSLSFRQLTETDRSLGREDPL